MPHEDTAGKMQHTSTESGVLLWEQRLIPPYPGCTAFAFMEIWRNDLFL